MMEKCCGYQIKLATIPVSDMQRSVPLNLYFHFPNIIPIVVGVGSCYRPVVLMSPKMLKFFKTAYLHSSVQRLLFAEVQHYSTVENQTHVFLLTRMSRLRNSNIELCRAVWIKNRLYLWNRMSRSLLRCTLVLQNVVQTHHAGDPTSKSLE